MNERIWICTSCRALLIQGDTDTTNLYGMNCPICGCRLDIKTQGS